MSDLNQLQTQPKKHAKLSASGSERWLNCPGSVSLCETAPPGRESKYANEGTKAHELLEGILKAHINLSNPYTTIKELRLTNPSEMVDHVANAFKEIEARLNECPGAILLSEEKIDLTHIGPDMFGTVDAAIVDEFGRLQVWDFKYGAGIPVDPEENTQLLYYAMGLAKKYDYNFKDVLIGIIQPRAEHASGPVRQWVISIKELRGWEEKFREGVEKTKDPLAAYAHGDWCRFCPAKAMCPEISTGALKQAKIDFAPTESSDVQIHGESPLFSNPQAMSNTLVAIEKLEMWIEGFKDQTFALMERGLKVPGFKLVKKRSIRRWVNETDAQEALLQQYPFSIVMETPKLKSPAQAEKIGIKKDLVAALTTSESSGLRMASISDKALEVDPLAIEFPNQSDTEYEITYTVKAGKEDKMAAKKKAKKKPAKKKAKKKSRK